jgi:hypothetical protein
MADNEIQDTPPAVGDDDGIVTQQQPPELSVADYRRLLDRLDALEREKAARDRADAAAAGQTVVHPDTHVLVLANGDTVTTCCPSITHVALDDEAGTVVPVVSRHELNPA